MAASQTPDLLINLTSEQDAYAHVVQLYSEGKFPVEEISGFVGASLAGGGAAVVIATRGHGESLLQKLSDRGFDLARLVADGRCIVLDAAETLSRIMVEGMPDPARFSEIIGGTITRAAEAAKDENHRVVAFGEMVALLWGEGKPAAAASTEKLWNQLARAYSFSLRCAYPMQGFCREEHSYSPMRICAEHSALAPEETYSELTSEDERLRSVVRLQQRMQVLLSEVESHRKDDQFRLFVEAVPDHAIFMLDAEGRVSSWNAGAARITGYAASEILGEDFSTFYLPKERQLGRPQGLLDTAIKTGHAEDESWRVRKDGSTFWANVALASVQDETGRLAGFGIVMRDLSERRRAEIALRQSEDRFRLMAEAVQDYAIFMLDPQGNVSTWNKGAERIKGYKAAEIIGRHFSCFYPDVDVRAEKPRHELEIAIENGRLEDEGWRCRKDGSMFWANVIITPVRDETNTLIGFTKVTRDVTDRMQKEKSLRDLTSRLLQMQDEERRRIGRDLHDTLGQCVTAMKISLDSLASGMEMGDGRTHEKVVQCVRLAEECVKEVRTISYLLYPPMLEEMGLKSAIPWYVEGFTRRCGIDVTFDACADFGRLPRDTELALFRVLQEGLTNVHRHSGSQTAHIELLSRDGMAVLGIRDRGKGMPPSVLKELDESDYRVIGVGLRGMRERLGQLGGKLEVSSTENGATVTATVPVTNLI